MERTNVVGEVKAMSSKFWSDLTKVNQLITKEGQGDSKKPKFGVTKRKLGISL